MENELLIAAKPLVRALAGDNGILLQLISIMGALRLLLKPLQGFLVGLAEITESKKDDELLAKLFNSKAFKVLVYSLDYLASIKLKKQEAVKEEPPKDAA